MIDLHRHDTFSFYDGSGIAKELAKLAKEKGLTSLGLANHGNTSGLIQHYDACKAVGIKPVLGIEGYFLPKHVQQHRGFHLCLFAKNLVGYRNMNEIHSRGDKQKFYNPIWDFKILSDLSEGVICTSACVAGYLAQCIIKKQKDKAIAYIKKMQNIFGDDFYIEIQPYVVSEKGLQEKVNIMSIRLAKKLGVKLILTSDSHRGRKEDLESYVKMHELKNNSEEYLEHVSSTYAERYMPDSKEMQKRFYEMHIDDFGESKTKKLVEEMVYNMEELEEKVNPNIIDELADMHSLPKFDKNVDSFSLLTKNVKKGLKKRGKYSKEYLERAKEELKVIRANNFEDYFLIVQDYTLYAKNKGIGVGPGRGSGCNCLVNYALEITDVDPIYFKLDFSRFIREDKKTLPDIDIDFETKRRPEVQRYILEKYEGYAVQIASYGMYKIDNLINDLAKTYEELIYDKETINQFKKIVKRHVNEEKQVDTKMLMLDVDAKALNRSFDGLIDSFCFLYNKVKYLGTHAAGVAISNDSIYYYTATRYNAKEKKVFASYNLVDLERCGIVKYDILGLGTLSSIMNMRDLTGRGLLTEKELSDENVLKAFSEGKGNGIFQYDSKSAQQILSEISTDNFNDVVAASAMNRPGPLSLGIPSIYAESKVTWEQDSIKPIYAEHIEETHGCILYQEQVNAIAVGYGGLDWNQADKLRKMDDPASLKSRELLELYHDEFNEIFVKSLKRYKITREEAESLFESFLAYTFNKGHSVGYALLSFEEMFNKVYYPIEFWFTKLNQADLDKNGFKFMSEAVRDGMLIFLPHVNYSNDFSIRKVEGEKIIQMGLSSIKGVGPQAAKLIRSEKKKNGIFKSQDDFIDRCKGQKVNAGTIKTLLAEGALEFKKSTYISRVKKFNSTMYSKVTR